MARDAAGWMQVVGLGLLFVPGAEPVGAIIIGVSGTLGTGAGVAHGVTTGNFVEIGTSAIGAGASGYAGRKALSLTGMVESKFNQGASRYISTETGRFVKTASGVAALKMQSATESLTGSTFDIFGQIQ